MRKSHHKCNYATLLNINQNMDESSKSCTKLIKRIFLFIPQDFNLLLWFFFYHAWIFLAGISKQRKNQSVIDTLPDPKLHSSHLQQQCHSLKKIFPQKQLLPFHTLFVCHCVLQNSKELQSLVASSMSLWNLNSIWEVQCTLETTTEPFKWPISFE